MSNMNKAMEIVSRHLKCIDVTYNTWTGRRILPNAQVQVSSTDVKSDQVTAPQAKLMPPDWRKRFTDIGTRKQRLLTEHTMPHMAPGLAAVRATRVAEFVEKLSLIRDDLIMLRTELINNYDTAIHDWNKANWKELFDDHVDAKTGKLVQGIKRLLPSREELEMSIDLRWSFLEVMPASIDLNNIVEDRLTAVQRVTEDMMQTQVNEFVDSVLRGPREQFRDAIIRLQSRIGESDRVTSATFNDMRRALSVLNEFHDLPQLKDSELTAKIVSLEAALAAIEPATGTDGKQLASLSITTKVRTSLSSAMSDIAARCVDESAINDIRLRFLNERGRDIRSIE